jgi:hypothetical protein
MPDSMERRYRRLIDIPPRNPPVRCGARFTAASILDGNDVPFTSATSDRDLKIIGYFLAIIR